MKVEGESAEITPVGGRTKIALISCKMMDDFMPIHVTETFFFFGSFVANYDPLLTYSNSQT